MNLVALLNLGKKDVKRMNGGSRRTALDRGRNTRASERRARETRPTQAAAGTGSTRAH